jgi:hypothetical protein
MRQPSNSINYYRHFVTDTLSNLELAMTVYSGDPVMYVAIDPSKKWPNKPDNFDFDSKSVA